MKMMGQGRWDRHGGDRGSDSVDGTEVMRTGMMGWGTVTGMMMTEVRQMMGQL